jgi:kelch-like protein 10
MVPENCIGIRKFANFYFCHNLEQSAINYIMNKFSEVVSKSTEFLQLDIDEVCVLLSSDYLNMKNEEHVFEAALRWIDYEPNSRKIHIARLLHTIRLGLLTTHYFVEKVKSHPYIKDVDQCRPIVIETLKFLYDLDMDERNDIDLSNPIAKPRIPHQVLFVIGGWSGGSPTNSVETYDTRADRWIACSSVDNSMYEYIH